MKPVTRRKASQVDPEEERLRNELMNAYLAFVQDAGYDGYPVQKVEGWPKEKDRWASFITHNAPGQYNLMQDPGFRNAYDLMGNFHNAFVNTQSKMFYNPATEAVESRVIDPSMYRYEGNEIAFQELPDMYNNDNFISIPRPRFRIEDMNPVELAGMEQEIPARQLQMGERPQQMDRLKSEPIMRADASVRGGQYQVGERVWDPEKKRWQNRMWDREDKKASREMQGELKEKWRRGPRNIETPPGGFKYGGKIKVKKKNC